MVMSTPEGFKGQPATSCPWSLRYSWEEVVNNAGGIAAWGSGRLGVMVCVVGFYTHGNILTISKELCAHATAPMWRSEGNFGEVVLSFHYLSPGVEYRSSGLAVDIPFSHQSPWP